MPSASFLKPDPRSSEQLKLTGILSGFKCKLQTESNPRCACASRVIRSRRVPSTIEVAKLGNAGS